MTPPSEDDLAALAAIARALRAGVARAAPPPGLDYALPERQRLVAGRFLAEAAERAVAAGRIGQGRDLSEEPPAAADGA